MKGQGVPKSVTFGFIWAHIGTLVSVNLAESCHNDVSKLSEHLATLMLRLCYAYATLMLRLCYAYDTLMSRLCDTYVPLMSYLCPTYVQLMWE